MKKLKLSLQSIEGAEVLTREQLKKLNGGHGSPILCASSGDCNEGYYCPTPTVLGYTTYCVPVIGGSVGDEGGSGEEIPGTGPDVCGQPHFGKCPGYSTCQQNLAGAWVCV